MTKIRFSKKKIWICIPSSRHWNLKVNCWLKWSRLNSQNLTFNAYAYIYTNWKSSSTRLFLMLAEMYSKPRAASISLTWISSKILLVLLVRRIIYCCFVFIKRSCLGFQKKPEAAQNVRWKYHELFQCLDPSRVPASVLFLKRNNHYVHTSFPYATCCRQCFRRTFW